MNRDVYPDNKVQAEEKYFNTYFEKTQSQAPETIYATGPTPVWSSVLLNKTVISEQAEDFADTIIEMWIPRCLQGTSNICNLLYQMHLTLPRFHNDYTGTLYLFTFCYR